MCADLTDPHAAAETAIREALAARRDLRDALETTVRLLRTHLPHYTWVGVYLLEGDVLVLGPYVGKPSPHTRIPLDRGLCGAAAREGVTIVVDDVSADPRYLACSVETKSEIVVPIRAAGRIVGEIDVDSDQPAAFGARDRALLETVAGWVGACFVEGSASAPGPGTR
jgi:L-methionine (R)-S-oxide reductase